MKKTLLFILLASLSILAKAQLNFSDSLRISLLTVDPGKEVYESFGHTIIRIVDQKNKQDVVFHYGVYDYEEPHFIWHFIEGICSYKMAGCYTKYILEDYRIRQINLTEQILGLDSLQARQLVTALMINYLPENRNYRYNFFFDNCATRPFDMINRCAEIQYDTTWIQPITLRDMLHEMTGTGHWLDFGIALAVAGRADQVANFREQMFLPRYLHDALSHATINGHPLVQEEQYIRLVPETVHRPKDSFLDTMLSPLYVGILMLLLAIGATAYDRKRHQWTGWGKSFDTLLLLSSGIAGCIIWFLNFFSLHPAVDNNLNCLWLLPSNLLFIAFIWIKKTEKVARIYFFIIFAAVIIYIISVCVSDQYCHPAFIPLLATLVIRSLSNTRNKQ